MGGILLVLVLDLKADSNIHPFSQSLSVQNKLIEKIESTVIQNACRPVERSPPSAKNVKNHREGHSVPSNIFNAWPEQDEDTILLMR